MSQIFIIGCGGGGSWLAPAMCLLVGVDNVTLIDGDILERKNLNRQLFTEGQIGLNKAEALAGLYGCKAMPDWYNTGLIHHELTHWLFGCVDNNPARASILDACDRYGCNAIFAANETTSSEAYVYLPRWKDTKLDPRVYYPSILTDHANDPQRAAIGCTGEAQMARPQLVTANLSSAALAGHLYVSWTLDDALNDPDIIPHQPYKLVCNLTNLETCSVKSI